MEDEVPMDINSEVPPEKVIQEEFDGSSSSTMGAPCCPGDGGSIVRELLEDG